MFLLEREAREAALKPEEDGISSKDGAKIFWYD